MNSNRKGYMLVEIIVAAVLAVGIAFYLLNLTYKFKNTNEDVNQSYYYMKDKILITKNIMNDLEGKNISNILISSDSSSETIVDFEVYDGENTENRRLKIDKINKVIEYGKYDSGSFDEMSSSYYYKELIDSMVIGDVDVSVNDGVATVNIQLSNIYDDNDYSIKLLFDSSDNSIITVSDVEPCVIDVTENNNSGSSNYFYGWNWLYTINSSYTSSFTSSYCNSAWAAFNPMCNSQQSSTEETTSSNCQKEVVYNSSMTNLGFTYVVKFKVNSDGETVELFGDTDDSSSRGFTGFKIDENGKLIVNFDGEDVSDMVENDTDIQISKNKWYVLASVFEYEFSTSNGYGFKTNYTFYVFDGSECVDTSGTYNDNICYWNANFTWSAGNNSMSTSASNFSVNYTTSISSTTSVDTGIEVTDALFYFKALDRNVINNFFGSKLTEAIDITDTAISNPLFYFKNHPTDEIYD